MNSDFLPTFPVYPVPADLLLLNLDYGKQVQAGQGEKMGKTEFIKKKFFVFFEFLKI